VAGLRALTTEGLQMSGCVQGVNW